MGELGKDLASCAPTVFDLDLKSRSCLISSRHEYPQYRKVHVNDMSLCHSRLIVGV